MTRPVDRPLPGRPQGGRHITIKDVAEELGLSITTISRALNGYPDVGESTRKRVADAAQRLGYRPNRNAQRLVTQRTGNIAWVQQDNDRKFVDPHFVETMAGVLRGSRALGYDVVLASETPENEMDVYDRFVNDNSVDGFILDLPRPDDRRVTYLLEAGRPFVIHGRDGRPGDYGWVDIDNYGNFYNLTRLLIANGHRRIAFINGDEKFCYAIYRRQGVQDAQRDGGLSSDALSIYNSLHPMGEAGFHLTVQALADRGVTALLYSSTVMAIEGNAAVQRAGTDRNIAIATMDDELQFVDLSPFAGQFTFVRSSLRAAGNAIISELVRQCTSQSPGQGHIVPSRFEVASGLDPRILAEPLPPERRTQTEPVPPESAPAYLTEPARSPRTK